MLNFVCWQQLYCILSEAQNFTLVSTPFILFHHGTLFCCLYCKICCNLQMLEDWFTFPATGILLADYSEYQLTLVMPVVKFVVKFRSMLQSC